VSDANLAPIVLGCSWPIRREILAEHSWKFSVLESDFNFEGVIGSSTDSPLHVAKATAHALSSHFDECAPPVVLLTVAQVFVVDGAVRHPAQTENDAIALLRAVSNKVITLRTAVVATQCPHGRQAEEIDECTVEFGPISDDLATRVAKRTFSKPCSGIPLRDPEIKLRCKLLSGSEEAALGMPIEAARRVVGAAVAPCGASEYSHKPFSR
jgi:predicted house-cleaning NTP pyrophosphatase (Maf/HAM1 superfamily)